MQTLHFHRDSLLSHLYNFQVKILHQAYIKRYSQFSGPNFQKHLWSFVRKGPYLLTLAVSTPADRISFIYINDKTKL